MSGAASVSDRKINDVGGLEAGPVERREQAQTLFEKRVDALVMLLTHPRLGAFKVDALRRAVEQNSPEDYATLGYYQKWLRAIQALLLEQEIITEDELDRKIAAVRGRFEKAGRV